MSIVIAVKVSEGLVLAADSAASLMGRIEHPEMRHEGVLKTFFNARKLLQIGDFPMGTVIWGSASIGLRTLESLISEWEHNTEWNSQKKFKTAEKNNQFRVEDCAKNLFNNLTKVYKEEFKNSPKNKQPIIGLIVAGYSEEEFFPEIWRFVIPIDKKPHNQRPDKNGKPDFGASWFGLTDPIVRLHHGRSEGVINIITKRFKVTEEEASELLAPLQYPVAFPQMPLQDAIEYANYMLNVVIGRYRFVLGPELCGGQIDIAAITQKNFKWIKQKAWGID